MRLEIKNIAKIEKADIEINGITVIAGENNMGKSTIGKVLYCLFEAFYNIDDKIEQQRLNFIEGLLKRNIVVNEKFVIDNREKRRRRRVNQKEVLKIYNDIILEISTIEDIRAWIYSNLALLFDSFEIRDEENFFNNINKMRSYDDKYIKGYILNGIFNEEFSKQYMPLVQKNIKPEIILKFKKGLINIDYDFEAGKLKENASVLINHEIFYSESPLSNYDNYIFLHPSNKNIIQNHEQKMDYIIKNIDIEKNTNLFDQLIGDENFELIELKLSELIGGNFTKQSESGELVFFEESLRSNVLVQNLSMGIKSISNLLLCIKSRYITENSTIILDKPEIHLHPKWQLKFAEILIMMQKQLNLHILVNTHSPYFINALEVYSAKHEIANKCKYYLATLNKNNRAEFEDVTLNLEKIYSLLSEPFQILADEEEQLNDVG